MYRGTTPTLYFKINNIDDLSTIKDAWITVKSGHICRPPKKSDQTISITKTLLGGDVVIDTLNGLISVTFTQEETLKFSEEALAQIKIRRNDETVCASPIFKIQVNDVLNTKVMKDAAVAPEPEEPEQEEEKEETPPTEKEA